jgi:lipopolysaccharide biosynthesis glycosyltransferase
MEGMHVSLIADDGYAMGLAVTLKSLLSSTVEAAKAAEGSSSSTATTVVHTHCSTRHLQHSQQQLHVWLIDVGLSADTHNKLKDMIYEHNSNALGRWLPAHAV